MNKEFVKEIKSNKLKDITFRENANILIGKYLFNQLTLGTYFIDFADNGFPSDIRDYQEKYISSEYYKTPGYIQWNYYLIFLRDSYQEVEKNRIEKDAVFTRKFVFTPNELTDYFEYRHSQINIDSDIIGIWKEKLRQVDLDEVYSEASYAQAVPRFLSNEVMKDNEEEISQSEGHQVLTISKISNIELKEGYRKYPLLRNFNLGKANLVKGVNGSGKTSFLEAIELMVAGKSNRNSAFNEEDGCITALYNDEDSDSYMPTNNVKYRDRDNLWYSSAYKKGNELYKAFNKYNFFDSDAAYYLSHYSDTKELTKYLTSIALGSEFNRIQKRLSGFRVRLDTENKSRIKVIVEEEARIKESKETIKNTKLALTPENNFQVFLSYSKEIQWNHALPKSHSESLLNFTEDYQTTQSLIHSLSQILEKFKHHNLKGMEIELFEIEKALDDCKNKIVNIRKINEILTVKRKDLETIDLKFQTFEAARKFYNNESSFSLWNLGNKINALLIQIKNETRAIEYFEKVIDQKIFQQNILFESYKKERLTKRQELKEKHKEIYDQIENLKSNLNELQKLISDIKLYGKQYITINRDAASCPLCDTPYSFDELSKRISNIAKSVDENVALDKLGIQLAQLEKELSMIEDSITDFQYIESGVSILHETEYYNLTLLEIGKIFNSIKNNLEKNNDDHSKLLRLRDKLEDQEFYEYEFTSVKEKIENIIPAFKFTFGNKAKFEEHLSDLENEKQILVIEIKKLEKEFSELNNSLDKIIEKFAPGSTFNEYERALSYRIELVKKGITYFRNLSDYLTFLDSEDLTDLSQKIDKLYKLYENVDSAISSKSNLKLANEIIVKSNETITELKPETERISKGLAVIDDILENYGESKVLGDFIRMNENEIQEIFKNIHSPKEFAKIIFDENENTVLLERKDNSKSNLSQISAGQRSALALSIFLALNKKLKHGPNIILFDDPVAFTDDLNILSFLDYLRAMIIHENRQIVFATANQKLGGLFEKKFAFLGEDNFKIFQFER